MREFYLIPKTVYDRYNNNNSKSIGGGDEKHSLSKIVNNSQNHRGMQVRVPISCSDSPQRPLKKIKNMRKINKPKDHIVLKTMNQATSYIDTNPSLTNLIDVKFPLSTRYNAQAFLKVIENIPWVKWNEQGDLLYPLNKYNILDVIEHIISPNMRIDSAFLDDYKYLISTMNIPTYLVRNMILKGYISTGSTLKRQLPSSMKPQSLKTTKRGGGCVRSLWASY